MFMGILRKFFSYNSFRGNQKEIIEAIIDGHNVLVIKATGGGKSLCYQLPALIKDGMALVISPLISLMKDQVDDLTKKNIAATYINSTLKKDKLEAIYKKVLEKKIKLLYISPESLQKKSIIELLNKINISFVAIDEVHCISDWGQDFRPEYRNIKKNLNSLGDIQIIALTATATPKVEADIIENLKLDKIQVFKSSFYRKNINYHVVKKEDPLKQLLNYLKKIPNQAGIIYCQSRKRVDEIARKLQLNNISSRAYHAGMDISTRIETQDLFIANEVDVIVATVAFGMGINKENVRFILHYDIPKSVEGYYQETGRAGRDGMPSECILLYDNKDVTKLKQLNKNKLLSERDNINILLDDVVRYANSPICRQRQILSYLGEKKESNCNHCDNCKRKKIGYDAQEQVLILLKCIEGSNNIFDINSLKLVLAGESNYQTNINGYDNLPIFGKGSEYSKETWDIVANQLLLEDYICYQEATSNILSIKKKGKNFIISPKPLTLYRSSLEQDSIERKKNSKLNKSEKLFKNLVNIRKKISKKNNVKPYNIFQEKALEDMATSYPASIKDLIKIKSITLENANKFGNYFLEEIKDYLKENKVIEPIFIKKKPIDSNKKIKLIQDIDLKHNLKDIAKKNKLNYSQLIKELEKISAGGIKLDLSYYLNNILAQDQLDDLADYFESTNQENIEQALEDLIDEFSEDEIRLAYIQLNTNK